MLTRLAEPEAARWQKFLAGSDPWIAKIAVDNRWRAGVTRWVVEADETADPPKGGLSILSAR